MKGCIVENFKPLREITTDDGNLFYVFIRLGEKGEYKLLKEFMYEVTYGIREDDEVAYDYMKAIGEVFTSLQKKYGKNERYPS